MAQPLSKDEFFKRLAQIPGITIKGEFVHGIRLLTDDEKKERQENAELIRQVICNACAADERSCGSGCLMAQRNPWKTIAAMIPVGTKLKKLPF